MREAAKRYGALVLALVTVMAVCLLFATRKNGMFIDEIYPYGLSNSHYAPFLSDVAGGELEDAVLTRQDLLGYVTVDGKGDVADFGSVYYNQSRDVHPPLYYWLFNLVCSLFPGSFSKWIGLGLDMVLYLLTLIALYRLVLALFDSRPIAVAGVLLYGLSGLGLSTMLMIRMYVLMTLLTVLLALQIRRLMLDGKPWRYPLIGLIVFLGLMTQYYFVFYAFFVCAFYLVWALCARRYRSLLPFSLCAFAGVGLLVAVFPACIQQLTADKLVSGGNALEQLSTVSQYGYRLGLFLREARHGLKAAVLVALAAAAALALLGLVKLLRKGAPKAEQKPLPWDALTVLLPALAAFVVVALISPVEEQRYIYPLAPILVALVCFLLALIERLVGDIPNKELLEHGALALVLILALLIARREPPMYLYPEDAGLGDRYAVYDALVAEHAEDPCLYMTAYVAPPTKDLGELVYFEDVFVTTDPESAALAEYLAARDWEECVVYIDVSAFWGSGFDPEVMLPQLLESTDAASWELLYENGLSNAYLIRK